MTTSFSRKDVLEKDKPVAFAIEQIATGTGLIADFVDRDRATATNGV